MSDIDDHTKLVTSRTLEIGLASFLAGVIATVALWSTFVVPDFDPDEHQLEIESAAHAPCEGAMCAIQRITQAPGNLYRYKKARGKLVAKKTFDVTRFVLLLTTTLPVSATGGFGAAMVGAGSHASYRFVKRRTLSEPQV